MPDSASIIALDRFIQATRDSGYKGTTSALAELVDNAIQAGAKRVAITIVDLATDTEWPVEVAVMDDGVGMTKAELRQALRFGGSSRFNDRAGLGRFGMGLPNASLSQAQRVDVYSWQSAGDLLSTYLDVDEIAAGRLTDVPLPKKSKPPNWPGPCTSRTGTLVVWSRCDRLDNTRISTISRKVSLVLGRMFRYPIWSGVKITVNGEAISPLDPLYLHSKSKLTGGTLFGDPLEFEVRVPQTNGVGERTGLVTVRFAELPVHEWHSLSNEEKRARGVSNGSGISVIRKDREIDYGWFFLNGKRRENYDDWWRCEVKFEPILDEAFGITHTKQQIRPRDYLLEAIGDHIEATAKALNARVREAHTQVKVSERVAVSEQVASAMDAELKPLPVLKESTAHSAIIRDLAKRHAGLEPPGAADEASKVEYRIVHDRIKDPSFFSTAMQNGRVVLVVNPEHPFYKQLYGPLMEDKPVNAADLRRTLELVLLAAARAEAAATATGERDAISAYRAEWSRTLAVFLNGSRKGR